MKKITLLALSVLGAMAAADTSVVAQTLTNDSARPTAGATQSSPDARGPASARQQRRLMARRPIARPATLRTGTMGGRDADAARSGGEGGGGGGGGAGR